ncbi:hypothetical protein [Vagococcus intermedius]|uniref:Uncharacterized protein n=1 Tax=Vagococcus intermedius TaxID=2991418 RepID=A0AAF0I8B0_9ENTE|nr:hypothetical protein [Vagococcus intermedius]WEG73979.1 hypothetical protein OL234_03455 [Vagococcus intermedius]WEG76059.1 hypothetical protein OL235_03460 [Vagococcus intermedius]
MKKFDGYFTKSLPLAGICITFILILFFIVYYGESSLLAWLYCLMPLVVNLLVSFGYRVIKKIFGKNTQHH